MTTTPSPSSAPAPTAIPTDAGIPVADLLKRETADAHHRAETHPVQKAFASGEIDRQTLAVLFDRMHQLLREVETRLESAATTEPSMAALREHATPHRDRLAADLAGLDPSGSPRPTSPAVASFVERLGGDTWPAAAIAGAFYVLEGSMNGNRFIRMGLEKRRPDLAPHLSYLDPYGDDQRPRWQRTRAALDGVARDDDARAAMLAAARATFDVVQAISDEVQTERAAPASTTVESKPTRRCPITGRTA